MMSSHRFPWRLFTRVVLVQTLLVICALLATGLAVRHFFKRQFLSQVETQLRTTLAIFAQEAPEAPPPDWCQKHSEAQSLRLTIVGADGVVLCDSHHDPKTMENHGARPEVLAARRDGTGMILRFSTTLEEPMLYMAVAPAHRTFVVRGAIPLQELARSLRYFDTSLAVVLVLVAIITALFTAWSARAFVFPIGRLVVKARSVLADDKSVEDVLVQEPYGELSDLEDSLDSIRRDLEAKADRLNVQSEELATLMSAISDSILAVDEDGAPLFYNSRFALLFGGDRLRTGSSRLFELFRDPEILGAFRAALKDGTSTAVNARPFEQEAGRKFFSISVAPLRRRNGVIYGAVGIFHDVTDLKLAEQIRIDFVANVSHELRTPLTAIKGYADTIRQDVEQGRAVEKDFVDVITRNTERLMSLINDLLDLSSLESHAENLHKAPVDTAEFTSRVLEHLRANFESKKQMVCIDVEAPRVLADPQRLEQVMVNLVDNARKYTPEGGKVTVAWVPQGNDVLLKVSDTGPGIPPEHHSRLFERFYRVDKARSRELGGTGLGLAIVKHIMQRHGGTVGVQSVVGQGATFICKFPGSA